MKVLVKNSKKKKVFHGYFSFSGVKSPSLYFNTTFRCDTFHEPNVMDATRGDPGQVSPSTVSGVVDRYLSSTFPTDDLTPDKNEDSLWDGRTMSTSCDVNACLVLFLDVYVLSDPFLTVYYGFSTFIE